MCEKRYTKADNLGQHKAAVHEGVRYNSDQCDATPFKYPHHLKQHKASEHERVGYSCD